MIRELCFNGGYCRIEVCTLGIRAWHIFRRIVKPVVNSPRQPVQLILRDLRDSVLAGESLLGDQALIGLYHIGNGQFDLGIPLAGIIPLIGQALMGFRVVIPVVRSTAVLAKLTLDEFLILIRRMRITEVGIDR